MQHQIKQQLKHLSRTLLARESILARGRDEIQQEECPR